MFTSLCSQWVGNGCGSFDLFMFTWCFVFLSLCFGWSLGLSLRHLLFRIFLETEVDKTPQGKDSLVSQALKGLLRLVVLFLRLVLSFLVSKVPRYLSAWHLGYFSPSCPFLSIIPHAGPKIWQNKMRIWEWGNKWTLLYSEISFCLKKTL